MSPARLGFLLGVVVWEAASADDISITPSITSDYDYRGVSQTASNPAAQIGLDWQGAVFHSQLWTSNVQFDRHDGSTLRHIEFALTGDAQYAMQENKIDVGVNYYYYPDWNPAISYPEVYFSIAHGVLSSTLHYTSRYDNDRVHGEAHYLELNLLWPLQKWSMSLTGHAGISDGWYWRATNGRPYEDWYVGCIQTIHHVEIGVRIVGTHHYGDGPRDAPFSGATRVVISATRAVAFSHRPQ